MYPEQPPPPQIRAENSFQIFSLASLGFISLLRHKEGGGGSEKIFTVCILCD